MTVCATLICDDRQAIVSVSDTMISLGSITSADAVTTKGVRVHAKWAALFAGDLTFVEPVLRQITYVLRSSNGIADELMNAFKEACREELVRRSEAAVLSVYNLSMVEFLQKGTTYFNPADHSRLVQDIEDIRTATSCQFLVHGFDPDGYAHLFLADHRGYVQEFGVTGCWAIGSGAHAALSSLFFHGVSVQTPLDLAIYHACEAKFMAQSASGVGTDTQLAILRADGTGGLLNEHQLAPIRRAWNKSGKPRLPQNVSAIVARVIGPAFRRIEAFPPA